MRISIIVPDHMMVVDGVARHIDMRGVQVGMHAVQWFDDHGDVEVMTPRQMNMQILDFSPFDFLMDRWIAAAPLPPEPPKPLTKDELLDRTLSDPGMKAVLLELAARQGLATELLLREAVKARLP